MYFFLFSQVLNLELQHLFIRGKCKTAYGNSHRRPKSGGLEIDIDSKKCQHTFMRSLELDIDYVYFQPPHMTIMFISKPSEMFYDYFQTCHFGWKNYYQKLFSMPISICLSPNFLFWHVWQIPYVVLHPIFLFSNFQWLLCNPPHTFRLRPHLEPTNLKNAPPTGNIIPRDCLYRIDK